MLVGSIAGRVKHAVDAVDAGVDFVIAQGYEAGGHTGHVALSVLLPQVVDAVGARVPVIAAGRCARTARGASTGRECRPWWR